MFYYSESMKGIQPSHASKLRRILGILDLARNQADLAIPGFRAHQLKGDQSDLWSIWVNGNWRVTFRFIGQNVELVDYRDYH